MRSIVTGGAGFIGSHLIDRLVARGDDVLVLDNLSSGKAEFLAHHNLQVTHIDVDITDFDACHHTLRVLMSSITLQQIQTSVSERKLPIRT